MFRWRSIVSLNHTLLRPSGLRKSNHCLISNNSVSIHFYYKNKNEIVFMGNRNLRVSFTLHHLWTMERGSQVAIFGSWDAKTIDATMISHLLSFLKMNGLSNARQLGIIDDFTWSSRDSSCNDGITAQLFQLGIHQRYIIRHARIGTKTRNEG